MDITFVVPCLNEEANIIRTIRTIDEACADLPLRYETLVIDDGSWDATARVVRDYLATRTDEMVRFHQNEVNRGLGFSFWYGATIARGNHYMVVGGDGELPADCIREMARRAGEAEALIAIPQETRNRPLVRRFFSSAFIKLFQATSGHAVKCVNTPMLLPTSLVAKRPQTTANFGYFAELMCEVLCNGTTCQEVPVSTIYRNTDKMSALHWKNFVAVAGTFIRIAARRLKKL